MNSPSIDGNETRQAVRLTLLVPEMDCPDEFRLIREGLGEAGGLLGLVPNYLDRTVQVEFDANQTDADTIIGRFTQIGFPATDFERASALTSNASPMALSWKNACVMSGAGLLLIAGVLVASRSLPRLRVAAAILSAITAGAPVAVAALRSLRLRRLDMNVLMVIAAMGALAIGEWYEAATAMTLFGVAHWLESLSLRRASQAIASLADRLPQTAHVISRAPASCERDHGDSCNHASHSVAPLAGSDGDENTTSSAGQDVPIESLRVGDVVAVKPGEPVPIDGEVVSGISAVTEAALTGESTPVMRESGDPVWAGTVNGEGVLLVRTVATAADSAVSQVGRLVEEARGNRSNTERFVDRFARYYTPLVIAAAMIVAGIVPLFLSQWPGAEVSFVEWFHRGLVLLVIACPCALVISTPVTMVCGLQRATQAGLLVKGASALERAATVDAIAFDKTGTLTAGRPVVTGVFTAAIGEQAEAARSQILQLAAAIESNSAHPIARAIVSAAKESATPSTSISELTGDARPGPFSVTDVTASPGSGISANVNGRLVRVGTFSFATERLDSAAEDAATKLLSPKESATTCVYVASEKLLGRIDLEDQLRDDAVSAINSLNSHGIQKTIMLTGDRQAVAASVASVLGITEWHAELLPSDKVDRIERARGMGATIAMVGDGFNDAPALAAADLGIAMGGGASGLAVESADVVVLSPQLAALPKLLRLASLTKKRLWFNIAVALSIKTIVLLITACGYGTMWLAVAADVGASMLVIFSGMGLLSVRLD